jgi:MFS transporter, ACS family, glucarate transporter
MMLLLMALPSSEPEIGLGPATRARYVTVVLALTIALVTYIDRVCISQAAPLISQDLGLTKIQMGWAFSVFAWAYALFEIPGGWLADRFGPRRVLTRIVIWWSFFTAATGWVWSFPSLLVTRTLFGAGEAGCFPNITRIFTLWLPKRQRERAQAGLWLAARWGGAFTPLLVTWVLEFVSWRRAFEIFGVLGVVWAIGYYTWFRDDPRMHASVNAAELAKLPPPSESAIVHGATPWSVIFSRSSIWLLGAQYICLSYGWYFFITWLPTYLREARGTSVAMGALLAGLPLLLGGVGCLFSGWIVPRLARAFGSINVARRIIAVIGFAGASGAFLVFPSIQDPTRAMLLLGCAGMFNDFVMPPAWAACMDIGGRYSGTVSGSMNMMGNIAGAISPLAIGYLLAWTNNNWPLTFYVSAAVYLLGAVCWLFIDTVTPIEVSE